MTEPAQSPVPAAVSKRLVTLIAAVLVTQVRRLGLESDDVALLYEVVDGLLLAGLGSHWLAPMLRKSVAKAKKDSAPKVSDAEERL